MHARGQYNLSRDAISNNNKSILSSSGRRHSYMVKTSISRCQVQAGHVKANFYRYIVEAYKERIQFIIAIVIVIKM